MIDNNYQEIGNDVFVHPTSIVDDHVKIGPKTRIWHFCHVSNRAEIGKSCLLAKCNGWAICQDWEQLQNPE